MNISANGNTNSGLTEGEIASLVVGIVGVILAALTVFIGWRSRRGQITNNIYYYPPESSHLRPDIPAPPEQDIPLRPVVSQSQPAPPALPLLIPSVIRHPEESHACTPTGRAYTRPDATS
ncbi:hypothetical protein BDD12DRAFT_806631 [Trichophaea hybrida]|nr:hypothetical protein BDD12DRAFT_806631 [Trichophaea hybrida]